LPKRHPLNPITCGRLSENPAKANFERKGSSVYRQLFRDEEKGEKLSYINDLREALLKKNGKCFGTVGRLSLNQRPVLGWAVVWMTVSL